MRKSSSSDILDRGIAVLGLAPTIVGTLRSHQILTVRQLVSLRERDLWNLSGMAKYRVDRVIKALAEHGLMLVNEQLSPPRSWYRMEDMLLRDWFAGMAMQGALSFTQDSLEAQRQTDWEDAAKCAYAIADAMMAERDKPEGKS